MRIHDEVGAKIEHSGSASKLTWLIAGIGIGAFARILLAPQYGDDTREWISTNNRIDTLETKAKRTRRVGDWIDQGQERVTGAINAGREAFKEEITESGF